jgi:hypothetical protein
MPYDLQADSMTTTRGLRDEILDLMARKSLDPGMSEQQYRAALMAIVACARRPVDDLWDKYHSAQADTRSQTYARFAY